MHKVKKLNNQELQQIAGGYSSKDCLKDIGKGIGAGTVAAGLGAIPGAFVGAHFGVIGGKINWGNVGGSCVGGAVKW